MLIKGNRIKLVWNLSVPVVSSSLQPCNENRFCLISCKLSNPLKFMTEGNSFCWCIIKDSKQYMYGVLNDKTGRYEDYRNSIEKDL